ASRPTLLGTLRQTPPAADQHDPASERYRWRLARRTLGIAQVHALHKDVSSARAIGRQLGINHGTVRRWLKLTPPDQATVAELSSHAWQADAEPHTLTPLRRQQRHLDEDHFVRLSAFLRNPKWESTNNAAERGGRTFRHGQHPHFRLRLARSIEADLEVRAY